MSARLIAVLGYSARQPDGLHPVCAERLRHAERLAGDADTVLFSGWARGSNGAGEAELMRGGWNGTGASLVSDTTARNTAQNAAIVAETARRVGASEVVIVTSRWHVLRARMLVHAALRQPGVSVTTSCPPGHPPAALVARELVCLAALPYHLLRLRGRRD